MILIIDNYDSFVYNLARYVVELGYECELYRNDQISIEQIQTQNYSHIILSPGPCTPNEAGICIELIKTFSGKIPILGVCLGHQTIAQAFGGNIIRANYPKHGKASEIQHHQKNIFQNLSSPLKVGRYHSLIVAKENLPECLEISALSEENEIMALEHNEHPTFGVQFHPESILTEGGKELLKNFCTISHHCEEHSDEATTQYVYC